jgi:hypothetical protein
MLGRREVYRGYAAECLAIAEVSTNAERKTILVEMAIAWLKLAEDAEEVGKILARPRGQSET